MQFILKQFHFALRRWFNMMKQFKILLFIFFYFYSSVFLAIYLQFQLSKFFTEYLYFNLSLIFEYFYTPF